MVFGDDGIGKRTLIFRLCERRFEMNPTAATMGREYLSRSGRWQPDKSNSGVDIAFNFYDLTNEHQSLTITRLRNFQVFLLCYDLTQPESLSYLGSAIAMIKNVSRRMTRPPVTMLVGLKSDLTELITITHQRWKELTSIYQLPSLVVSSKDGDCTEKLFDSIFSESVARSLPDLAAYAEATPSAQSAPQATPARPGSVRSLKTLLGGLRTSKSSLNEEEISPRVDSSQELDLDHAWDIAQRRSNLLSLPLPPGALSLPPARPSLSTEPPRPKKLGSTDVSRLPSQSAFLSRTVSYDTVDEDPTSALIHTCSVDRIPKPSPSCRESRDGFFSNEGEPVPEPGETNYLVEDPQATNYQVREYEVVDDLPSLPVLAKSPSQPVSSISTQLRQTSAPSFRFGPPEKEKRAASQTYVDFNTRFQKIMEYVRTSRSLGIIDSSVKDIQRVTSDLIDLKQDFLFSVKTYGRLIITEKFLPIDAKSIKPTNMGGSAGGEKYLVNHILFKFATQNTLYKTDYAAAKVAGHELKGLNHYMSTGVQGLSFSMMCLLDFLGYRLVAMTLLPISQTTLKYGTSDGGVTVHSDPTIAALMEAAGKHLNLAPHVCGSPVQNMYSACDVEAHLGTDGRHYLIDFSRSMPPVTPDLSVPQGHLYQLFRSEAVVQFPRPLCPDAFSGFISSDPSRCVYNADIREATDWLLNDLIPKSAGGIAINIMEAFSLGSISTHNISADLHSYLFFISFIFFLFSIKYSFFFFFSFFF